MFGISLKSKPAKPKCVSVDKAGDYARVISSSETLDFSLPAGRQVFPFLLIKQKKWGEETSFVS